MRHAARVPAADAGGTLTCQFEVTPEALTVRSRPGCRTGATLPGNQSFSWQVLTALAGEVTAEADGRPGRHPPDGNVAAAGDRRRSGGPGQRRPVGGWSATPAVRSGR